MNFISKDTLDELENPSRLFREQSTLSHIPSKLKAKDIMSHNTFQFKRESMGFDDLPNISDPFIDGFFSEPVPIIHNDDDPKLLDIETQDSNQKIAELTSLEVQQALNLSMLKYKRTKYSSVISEDSEIKESELNSDNKDSRIEIKKPQEINIISTDHNHTSPKDSHIICIENTKRRPIIEKPYRKSFKTDREFQKQQLQTKRRIILQQNERNLLKSRIAKVAKFWKGENTYIPSVFKVICLIKETEIFLVEFQDFSLKGLSHMIEDVNDELLESKLSRKLDLIGEKNFSEDISVIDATDIV